VFVKGTKLEFRIALTKATGLGAGVPTGNDGTTPLQQAKYVVRWDFGGQVYYAGANVAAAGSPAYFSGKVSTAEGITSPTNADNLNGFGNTYAALGPATGHVTQNGLVIDVPRSAIGKPKSGSKLYSVGTYTMVGGDDSSVTLETLPITVDSSPTFDTKLGTTTISPKASLLPSITGGTLLSLGSLALLFVSAGVAGRRSGRKLRGSARTRHA
jgi:hypothetical protein